MSGFIFMYENIKHASFQPAEKEITLLYFDQNDQIMIRNKKSNDAQLYIDVIDVVQTLGGIEEEHAGERLKEEDQHDPLELC